MRHAVERMRAETLADPAPAPFGPDPALPKEVFAAFQRAAEQLGGSGVAMKPKQAEDRASAAADDVETLVRRDEVVGELLRHGLRVHEHGIVTQALRDHRQ